MKYRSIVLLMCCLFAGVSLFGQQTTYYTEALKDYKAGEAFYEEGLYGKAQRSFREVLNSQLPINEPRAELLRAKAEFYYAKCAILLDDPDGEKLILEFIRTHRPDPIADQAVLEIANYYFDQRDYDQALDYFEQIPTLGITQQRRAEVRFKMGYAYFVKEDFDTAKSLFKEVEDIEGEYYTKTNYYLGLCYFLDGDYSQAISRLRIAENDERYANHIPYYLTQIYFAERRFEELLDYAVPKLKRRGIRERKEMEQLVGQAYFEQEQYEKALPHLKYYAENSSELREEEFYQLGFTQYQTGNYREAIQSFKPLSSVNSALGQNAMFYLADCYLKDGQKANALNALAAARRMDYDDFITEEATFNYAKLAYELNQSREAVSALRTIPPDSKYYLDAQKLMSEIFLSYRDYQQAIDIIENMADKDPNILETYQKVTLYRGIQLMQEGQLASAAGLFRKSLEYPIEQKTKALATYWLGDIAHRQGRYEESIRRMNEFLTAARTLGNMPDESNIFTANYLQGYNYFKKNNYATALPYFVDAVEGLNRNSRFIRNEKVSNELLGDAALRAGDCHFKQNQYGSALQYYNRAIENRYPDFVYAMFQKAVIEGLRGRATDKILALEKIANNYPRSEYADDALLQLGATYQEIGRLEQAASPLKRLIREYRDRSPLINQALIKLGLITYNRGNLAGAIEYYKRVVNNNPSAEEAGIALNALEEIYIKDLGRPNEYFAFLETTGQNVDNFARDSINFKAAVVKFENGNYERAVAAYTNYLNNFPNGRFSLQAHFQRGESYSVLRRYSQALQDYEYVVDQGQSRYYNKALEKAAIIAYNHEQNFEKAFEFYTKLETAAPNEDIRFEAQLGALRSAYRTNNVQALYTLANKVSNNPNATEQQRATANFYLGKLAYDRQDYAGALNALNKVVEMSDNEQTAEARFLIAKIHYEQRELATAKELLIKANQESSAYPYWVAKSILLLSDVLREQSDLYNARAALEALLENYDEDPQLVSEARRKLQAINQQIEESSRLNRNPDSGAMEFSEENNSNSSNTGGNQ